MTVEELLNKKDIKYKYSGNDLLVHCLSPDHDDSNPSMRIDRVLGIFNCLSCGFKGNIFKYYDETANEVDIRREKVARLIDRIRLQSVGLKMPDNAIPVEFEHRVSQQVLQEFEAFTLYEAPFEDRIVFPVRDIKENIVAFMGRGMHDLVKPKYIISPKGVALPLFPMSKIKPIQGRIILVEGIFDLLNLWDNGLTNVICSFGINNITTAKLELLKLLNITGIDICYDSDKAGQGAAKEVKKLAEEKEFNVRIIKMKEGTDPGSLNQKYIQKLKESLYG